MAFSDYARRQAQTTLDALVSQTAKAAREELETVRIAFDRQIAASIAALASPDQRESLEHLVENLSRAATEEAEAAATLARLETQEAAQAQLAAARAEAQRRLDAEVASSAALLTSLEEARRQVHTTQVELAALHAARTEIEARLEQAQAAKTDLVGALAELHRKAAAVQLEAQASSVSLAAAQARLQSLEEERTQLQKAHTEAEARRDAETRERMALTEALDDAREAASLAKAETEAYRDEIQTATERVHVLEEAEKRLEAEVQALAEERRAAGVERTALDRVRSALRAFDGVTTVNDILETLVAQLAHEFARAAIFLVRGNCLEGWRSFGLDPGTTIENLAIPLTVDSLLTRAVSAETSEAVTTNPDAVSSGLFGGPIQCAVALPVFADERVIAVAYGEQPRECPGDAAGTGQKIAEILVHDVSRRLDVLATLATPARPPDVAPYPDSPSIEVPHQAHASPQRSAQRSAPPAASQAPPRYPGPTRQAHRVKMHERIEVSVDGNAGLLVDLSSHGAQLLSPQAMRPNHAVRLLLPTEDGSFSCKGRIVWAMFEMSRTGGMGVYRAGVKFTDVDLPLVKAFLVRLGLNEKLHA